MVTWQPKIYQEIFIHELWALGPKSCMYHFLNTPKCGTSSIEVGPQKQVIEQKAF